MMSVSKSDPDIPFLPCHCLICYAETEDLGAKFYISSLCHLLNAEGLENVDIPVDLCSLCYGQVIALDQVIAQVTTLVSQVEEIRQGFITQLGEKRDEDQFESLNLLRHHISSQYEANYSESVLIESLDPLSNDGQAEIFELKEVFETEAEVPDYVECLPSPMPIKLEDPLPETDVKPELLRTKKCSVVLEKIDVSEVKERRRGRKRKKKLKELPSETDNIKVKGKLSTKIRAIRLKKLLKRARVEYEESSTEEGSINSESKRGSKINRKQKITCFPCRYGSCAKIFQKESTLRFHVKKIHEGSKFPYACQDCDQSFNAFSKLSIHRRKRHTPSKDSVECSQCNRILAGEARLKIHLEKQGGVCQQSSLPCNSRVDESNKAKKFVCGVCSYRCRSRNILKLHCYKHTKERPLRCDFCSSGFTRKQDLRHHQEAKHPEQLEVSHEGAARISRNPFQCTVCLKVYSTPGALKIHQVHHTKEYKVHCPVCGQGMHNKCKLDLHMVVHTTERSFLCDLCPTTFKRVDKLRRHKLTVHAKSRPFLCDSCPKAFGDNFGLQRHIRLKHAQDIEKQFDCTLCNLSFTLKDYLNVHQKSKKHKNMLSKLGRYGNVPPEHVLVEEQEIMLGVDDQGIENIEILGN